MNHINRRRFLNVAGLAAGSGLLGLSVGRARAAAQMAAPVSPADVPDIILNPVEVSGAEAIPVFGRLPGSRHMYVLPSGQGEFHRIGGHVMTRVARALDTGNVYEMATFAGRTGAAMPRHMHRGSHAALLVMNGEVEVELAGARWRMLRGDFANILPALRTGGRCDRTADSLRSTRWVIGWVPRSWRWGSPTTALTYRGHCRAGRFRRRSSRMRRSMATFSSRLAWLRPASRA